MKLAFPALLLALVYCQPTLAQPAAVAADPEAAVRQQFSAYVQAFNKNDAAKVAALWTEDAISLCEDTGEEVVGRDALQKSFAAFFADSPGTKLSGSIDFLHMIRPDVARVDGLATLTSKEGESVDSEFTAILVKQNGKWLISDSKERDLQATPASFDALKEMDWFVGNWQDQTDGADVRTTVRWAPSKAFLIRSFAAQFDDGDQVAGTQVFGWDPAEKQIRTWTFNSDGSYGEGTVAKHGEDWTIKMSHRLTDGGVASATHVLTRIDSNTIKVQKIGESVDGEPLPAGEPITVVRVGGSDSQATSENLQKAGENR